MGTRGPVPKRSEQRRRVNAPAIPVTRAPAGASTRAPALRRGIHPLARRWYASLGRSGQSRFYEPSDWAVAQLVAEAIDAFMAEPTAKMLSVAMAGSSSLLATEGDRRRLSVELQRQAGDADEDAAVAALADYRDRLA